MLRVGNATVDDMFNFFDLCAWIVSWRQKSTLIVQLKTIFNVFRNNLIHRWGMPTLILSDTALIWGRR